MKRSIKFQLASIFISILTLTVVMCMLANILFLKHFYLLNKKNDIKEAYNLLNQASREGKLHDGQFQEKLNLKCETSDLSIIVIDKSSDLIASIRINDEDLLLRIEQGILELWPVDDFQNLKVQMLADPFSNNKYMQMKGYLDNGESFLIRCAYIAVEDNVYISNKFLLIVGLIGLTVGIISIIFFTNKLTKPIVSLSDISSKMANLDFDAKYDSKGENEIDMLGENINRLSYILEKTISELKCANKELTRDIERKTENEEMRKEFIANVSHELKTPIALIQSYSEGLKEGIIDDDENKDYYLDVIIDESNRMNNLVKELMTLSELEFGNKPIEVERFDIVELIKNKISSSNILIKQKDISISFECEEEKICVWADEFKTEEVLSNYLSNAIHYCDDERKIVISVLKKEEFVRINVFNTGKPIPDEDMERIWEKFYKADKARSRDYGGSGIGLSIVKAIMTGANLDFGCYNTDGGVNFYFELPIK